MYLCRVKRKTKAIMDKETKKRLIMELARLKALSKMNEYTFHATGERMPTWKMDKLLDSKLEIDRRIKLIERVLEEADKTEE